MADATAKSCPACPTCHSVDPRTVRSDCYNPWHQGRVVHFQLEPGGTLSSECHAACSVAVADSPSELAVDLKLVSCPQCLAAVPACAGCGDALTADNCAPLESWCTLCHSQNMAEPVDYEAIRSVGQSALSLREAFSEALDMLDGYDDGRLSRVAALRERFSLPLDPEVARRRTWDWAVKERGRPRPVLETRDDVATAYLVELSPKMFRQLVEYADLKVEWSPDGRETARVDVNTRPFVFSAGRR